MPPVDLMAWLRWVVPQWVIQWVIQWVVRQWAVTQLAVHQWAVTQHLMGLWQPWMVLRQQTWQKAWMLPTQPLTPMKAKLIPSQVAVTSFNMKLLFRH
jgi:hypothetical protein